jgi:hypothetical protein
MDPSVCCENAFHTGSKYEVVVRTASVCCPCAKFLLDVFVLLSGAPLSAVVSDAMGVELFFLARTVSSSGAPVIVSSVTFFPWLSPFFILL